jgi:integrase
MVQSVALKEVMMSVYKRGNFYWYRFVWRGGLIAESTKQSNKTVADNQERAHRLHLSNGELGIVRKKQAPTLAEYFKESVLPWAESQFAAKPKSFKWYRDNAKVLLAFDPLKDARLDEIGKEVVDEFKRWRQKQNVGVHTVNSSLRALRAVLHRATLERLRNPLVKGEITILAGAKSRERVVTREDEKKYLEACTEPLRSTATILVDTGLRPEECFRLKWECVTFTKDGGRIFNEHGKSKAARRAVSMTQRVRGILSQRWSAAGEPADGWVFPARKAAVGHIVPNTIYQPHLDAVKRSGVRPFVLYSLRHTFLTRLGQSGCSPWTLAKIAGHSDINISKHYVHASDDDAAEAIKKLESSETNMKQNENKRRASQRPKFKISSFSTMS